MLGELFITEIVSLKLTSSRLTHVEQINRLSWRPNQPEGTSQHLAMCSDDRTVRILQLNLN